MEKKTSKNGVFTLMDLKMHQKLTNDLVEHAKFLSKKFYKYKGLFNGTTELDCSSFFDPSCIDDYRIYVSDFKFDIAIPYIEFTAIDGDDEIGDVAEMAVSLFRMSHQQLDKLEKECEKMKRKYDKEKEEKKAYEEFLRLKKKFECKKN